MEEVQKLAEKVLHTLALKDLTLALAESVSGGLASHLLTNITGSSKNYIGSVICYTAQSKNMMLDVSWDLINDYGTISPEVTEALLDGLKKEAADVGVAIVGVGGRKIEGKPTGLVYIGTGTQICNKVHEFHFTGTRLEIKFKAVKKAFEILLEELSKL